MHSRQSKGQTSALESWPLQPAPLTAYSTYGLNLLTTGQLHYNEDREKLQLSGVAPITQTSANFAHYPMPQYLTNQQQYFAFNRAFFPAPFAQYVYSPGRQFLPQLIATIPTTTYKSPNNGVQVTPITTTKIATKRPVIRDREPTTRKPQGSLQARPPKLQIRADKITQEVADFKMDTALLQAVGKINPQFVIEDIIRVPGNHVLSTKAAEEMKTQQKIAKSLTHKQTQTKLTKKHIAKEALGSSVKVEATGRTSTKGDIPEVPFGSYFLPYYSQNQMQQQQQSGKKTAALILEPHSKAIVGNGGTAISTPLSKAYLKRGVATNVYFNPESVAIAGVGGKAHAQADLELDLIN